MRQKRTTIPAEQSQVVAVRLARVDADVIGKVAEQAGITRSDVIRWAIAEWEERHVDAIRQATGR